MDATELPGGLKVKNTFLVFDGDDSDEEQPKARRSVTAPQGKLLSSRYNEEEQEEFANPSPTARSAPSPTAQSVSSFFSGGPPTDSGATVPEKRDVETSSAAFRAELAAFSINGFQQLVEPSPGSLSTGLRNTFIDFKLPLRSQGAGGDDSDEEQPGVSRSVTEPVGLSRFGAFGLDRDVVLDKQKPAGTAAPNKIPLDAGAEATAAYVEMSSSGRLKASIGRGSPGRRPMTNPVKVLLTPPATGASYGGSYSSQASPGRSGQRGGPDEVSFSNDYANVQMPPPGMEALHPGIRAHPQTSASHAVPPPVQGSQGGPAEAFAWQDNPLLAGSMRNDPYAAGQDWFMPAASTNEPYNFFYRATPQIKAAAPARNPFGPHYGFAEESTPPVVRIASHEELPSRGSADHNTGNCRPCAHIWKTGGCSFGKNCDFCHACEEDAFKRTKKDKVVKLREAGVPRRRTDKNRQAEHGERASFGNPMRFNERANPPRSEVAAAMHPGESNVIYDGPKASVSWLIDLNNFWFQKTPQCISRRFNLTLKGCQVPFCFMVSPCEAPPKAHSSHSTANMQTRPSAILQIKCNAEALPSGSPPLYIEFGVGSQPLRMASPGHDFNMLPICEIMAPDSVWDLCKGSRDTSRCLVRAELCPWNQRSV